jgi:hypothetical protein
MKLWGKSLLPADFDWTPTQLLELIKEADKICPEEGMLDLQSTDPRPNDPNNDSGPE